MQSVLSSLLGTENSLLSFHREGADRINIAEETEALEKFDVDVWMSPWPSFFLVGTPWAARTSKNAFKNNSEALANFLNSRHRKKYMLFNLSQKPIVGYDHFDGQVVEMEMCESLDNMFAFSHAVRCWLELDPESESQCYADLYLFLFHAANLIRYIFTDVAVAFCNNGRRRSALAAASFLIPVLAPNFSDDAAHNIVTMILEQRYASIEAESFSTPSSARFFPLWGPQKDAIETPSSWNIWWTNTCARYCHYLTDIVLQSPSNTVYRTPAVGRLLLERVVVHHRKSEIGSRSSRENIVLELWRNRVRIFSSEYLGSNGDEEQQMSNALILDDDDHSAFITNVEVNGDIQIKCFVKNECGANVRSIFQYGFHTAFQHNKIRVFENALDIPQSRRNTFCSQQLMETEGLTLDLNFRELSEEGDPPASSRVFDYLVPASIAILVSNHFIVADEKITDILLAALSLSSADRSLTQLALQRTNHSVTDAHILLSPSSSWRAFSTSTPDTNRLGSVMRSTSTISEQYLDNMKCSPFELVDLWSPSNSRFKLAGTPWFGRTSLREMKNNFQCLANHLNHNFDAPYLILNLSQKKVTGCNAFNGGQVVNLDFSYLSLNTLFNIINAARAWLDLDAFKKSFVVFLCSNGKRRSALAAIAMILITNTSLEISDIVIDTVLEERYNGKGGTKWFGPSCRRYCRYVYDIVSFGGRIPRTTGVFLERLVVHHSSKSASKSNLPQFQHLQLEIRVNGKVVLTTGDPCHLSYRENCRQLDDCEQSVFIIDGLFIEDDVVVKCYRHLPSGNDEVIFMFLFHCGFVAPTMYR
eukprot:UC4_evm5s543